MGGTSGGECGAGITVGRQRLAAWVLAALADDILVAQLLAMGGTSGGDIGAGLAVGRPRLTAWMLAEFVHVCNILHAWLLVVVAPDCLPCLWLAIGRPPPAALDVALLGDHNLHAGLLVCEASGG